MGIWLETYSLFLKRGVLVSEAVAAADEAKAAWDERNPARSVEEIIEQLNDPAPQPDADCDAL